MVKQDAGSNHPNEMNTIRVWRPTEVGVLILLQLSPTVREAIVSVSLSPYKQYEGL